MPVLERGVAIYDIVDRGCCDSCQCWDGVLRSIMSLLTGGVAIHASVGTGFGDLLHCWEECVADSFLS